jgi:hypothetical protein
MPYRIARNALSIIAVSAFLWLVIVLAALAAS